jgi:N-methylhydantoinase B
MAQVSDPIRLEVIRNALDGIGDGMALTLSRTSRSAIVRIALDFSTGILNTRGELIGQGLCLPLHLGGMMPALHACLARFNGWFDEGDIVAVNDPYSGGSHLPDIFLFKSVFIDRVHIGYVCSMAHQTDIGGRVPGGNACDSTEIYQEGLRIPPVKVFEGGRRNETFFSLLEAAVRVPETVLGDFSAMLAALEFGEREYRTLVGGYRVNDWPTYVDELLDYSERLTRQTIADLPDGTWSFSDFVDDDGITDESIEIVATITKKGDEIHLDFAGTSPQCRGAIQPVIATTRAVSLAVFKCVLTALGVDVPNNAGYFRPFIVSAPEGCFVNPRPPAAVGARGLGYMRAGHAVIGAFAKMLPELMYTCPGSCELGVMSSGYVPRAGEVSKPWVLLDFHSESAMGARPDKDGIEAAGAGINNIANIPVEQIEAEYPIRIEEYGLLSNTEGPGKFRGALGMARSWRYLAPETTVQVRSDRMKTSPWGLAGGGSANPTRIEMNSGGETRSMPSKFQVTMTSGDLIRAYMPGSGGWGPASERDPRLVARDVSEEKISIERAADKYRVAVNSEDMTVDVEATERLRDRERGSPVTV